MPHPVLKRFKRRSAAAALSLFMLALPAAAVPAEWTVSPYGAWRLQLSPDFAQGQGSPSRLLTLSEALSHHKLTLRMRQGLTANYSISCACLEQSSVPVLELRVPSLDIALNDQIRGTVFARFLVDSQTEYSLRGEIQPPGRIVFAPVTKSQEQILGSLWLQMLEGGKLQAALLQGKSAKPRTYDFSLAGFAEPAAVISADCAKLFAAAGSTNPYLPDYLTTEPAEAAPEDYSLKPRSADGLQPRQPMPEPAPAAEPQPAPQPAPVLEFRPGGGPASIGPDGRPVMSAPPQSAAVSGENADRGDAVGAAPAPMAIGADGQPAPLPAPTSEGQ